MNADKACVCVQFEGFAINYWVISTYKQNVTLFFIGLRKILKLKHCYNSISLINNNITKQTNYQCVLHCFVEVRL